MNEQIKLLAEQANKDLDGAIPVGFAEKFAELIVKECAQYIEDKFDFCGDEIIIAESVLKHFGVEE